MAFVAFLKLFLIALWLGAALFFSAVVAPGIFSVLRMFQVSNTGEIAGTFVTRSLSAVNVGGFAISVFLLAIALVRKHANRRLYVLELISTLVIVIMTGLGQWLIAARMRALRAAMVIPIDRVPMEDLRRVEFNRLHGYSVSALGLAMIAGLVAFAVVAYRARLNTH